jgi:hypothetical protein
MFANFRTPPSTQPPLWQSSSQPHLSVPESTSKPSSIIPFRRERAYTEPTPPSQHGSNTHTPPNYKFSEIQITGSLRKNPMQSQHKPHASEMPSPFTPIQQISESFDKGSADSVESFSSRGHRQHALDALPESACEDRSSISEKSDQATQIALKGMLDEIFAGFLTPTNEQDIEALKNARLEAMTRRNIGPAEFKQRLERMECTDDMVSLVSGSFSALGFILGYYLFTALNPTLKNNLPANALPYAPGGVTGMVDCYLRGLLERAHVGCYTSPDPAVLEDVMQEFLARHGRPLTRKILLLVGALSPYTMRNLLRSLIAPLAEHFGLAPETDLAIDNLGGLFFAGPLVQHLGNQNDQQDHLRHPAYFFGRTDWESEFEKLGEPGYRRFARFLKQACKGSIQTPNMLLDAGKELFTIESMTEISLLMAGFACNSWIKQMVGEAYKDASPEAAAFVENSAGTAFLAGLYCSLSFAMAGVKELKAGAGRVAQKLVRFQPNPAMPALSIIRRRAQPDLPERF